MAEPEWARTSSEAGSSGVAKDAAREVAQYAKEAAGWAVKDTAGDHSQDSARVSAARALIVVRRRTGRPIPAEVLELAGAGWE